MEKLPGFPRCEHFHHHLVPVILPQPYADGNGKAQLFSAVSVLGDVTGYGFAENIFGSATCNLGVFGKACCQVKDFLVKKRHTDFQGMGHAHLVGFLEDVAGKPVVQVDGLHFLHIL